MPDDFIVGLSELDDATWQAFFSRSRPDLSRWWLENNLDALRRVFAELGEVLVPRRTTRTAFGMVLPDAVATTAAGAGIGAVASELGASGRLTAAAGAATAGATALVLANAGGRAARRTQRRIMETAQSTVGLHEQPFQVGGSVVHK